MLFHRMDKGYAVSKKDQEEDMAMIANIGANALRLAHTPFHKCGSFTITCSFIF